MKTKLLAISITLGAVSTSWALSFKANIPNNPVPKLLMAGRLPSITNSVPGKTAVRVKRMCGDGDVAHYSSERPNFKFVSQSTSQIKTLVGVWVTEEGSITPSKSNWIPVGHGTLSIPMGDNSDYIAQPENLFLPVNKSGPAKNASDLLSAQIFHLVAGAKESFGSSKNYRIYAGMFVCHEPNEGESLTSSTPGIKPGPVDIMHSLMATEANAGVHKLAKNFIDSVSLPANDLTLSLTPKFVKVSAVNGSYGLNVNQPQLDVSALKYELGVGLGGGKEITGNSYDLAKAILKLSLPSVTGADAEAKLNDYKNKIQEAVNNFGSSNFSKLSALSAATSTSSRVDSCSSVAGFTTSKSAPSYDWENFPLNLSCKYLYGQGDDSFASAFKALFIPNDLPDSDADFKSLQRKLALRLYTGAVVETAQKQIKADSALAVVRPNCFIESGNSYINEIVYSTPIRFSLDSVNNRWVAGEVSAPNLTVPSAHPESLYALNDYMAYESSKDVSVFGMAINNKGNGGSITQDVWDQIKSSWGIALPLAPLSNGVDEFKAFDGGSMQKAINIDIRIRSIGGSCTIYC